MGEYTTKKNSELEVEDIIANEVETKKLYEFEVLLSNEEKRRKYVKAKTLVKLGLFKQETVKKFNFAEYTNLTLSKRYKGLYQLYENKDGNLVFVNGKLETDSNTPYEYDILVIEPVDDEIYQDILKASMHEGNSVLNIAYISSITCLLFAVIWQLIYLISLIIAGTDILSMFTSQVAVFLELSISTALIGLLNISYKKFVNKK